jgi:hypothetical protein
MTDAGMPMPALVLRMPMPSYAVYKPSTLITEVTNWLERNYSGGIPRHLKPRVLADTLGLPSDSTILKPRPESIKKVEP